MIMKVCIYLLLCCIFQFQFSKGGIISSSCYFQYGSESGEFGNWDGQCLCGPEKQPVGYENNKYCCVQNRDTCKDEKSTKWWCPNATALFYYQPCDGTCGLLQNNPSQIKCPSNPNYCMDKGKNKSIIGLKALCPCIFLLSIFPTFLIFKINSENVYISRNLSL